jgi:hypothetical protein
MHCRTENNLGNRCIRTKNYDAHTYIVIRLAKFMILKGTGQLTLIHYDPFLNILVCLMYPLNQHLNLLIYSLLLFFFTPTVITVRMHVLSVLQLSHLFQEY